MKPICVPCQRFYRPFRNGVRFVEGMPVADRAISGTTHPEQWKPYKLWLGDHWRCDGCGNTIIVGVAREPLAEHFQPNFLRECEDQGAEIQVNDC